MITSEVVRLYKIKIGFAFCGSFCTFEKAIEQLKHLVNTGFDVTPIMSFNAYSTDTRFGKAEKIRNTISSVCSKDIIASLTDAEPVGPGKMFDVLIIEPCTGNTLSKLANGITDTPVTLAAKSHLRNGRPVVIGLASNDGLSASAQNIGRLLNVRNVFFVPMGQDDSFHKPRSLVCEFSKTEEAVAAALDGCQIQPVFSYHN